MRSTAIAAHWKYKEDGTKASRTPSRDDTTDMAWLRQLLDWQRETADPGEFLESLRFEINTREVYVFTPKGGVIALPAGSTPVDFAYAVHTEVGHHCIGARVNGRLVPLESVLENGDIVEVLTSKADGAGPSRDWLLFVRSPRARNKIRQWFTKERREEAIDAGKDAIAKALRKQNLPLQRLMGSETMNAVVQRVALHGHRQPATPPSARATSRPPASWRRSSPRTAAPRAPARISPRPRSPGTAASASSPRDPGVLVVGASDVWAKLARCCTPVPGDPIIGFVTRGSGVSVHRRDCTNAQTLHAAARTAHRRRMVAHRGQPVPRRDPGRGARPQRPALRRDPGARRPPRQHPVGDRAKRLGDRVASLRFTFEMGDPGHLDHVIKAVRRIDGVYDVYRINGASRPN